MPLITLVYVSVATEPMSDAAMKDILTVARDFNGSNDITGMLLYRDDFFIQALEGEENVVETLYDKISQDRRHSNILLVLKNKIETRSFTQWSMGFNKLSDADVEAVPGLNDFLQDKHDMGYFTRQPSRASLLLETFKDRTYF